MNEIWTSATATRNVPARKALAAIVGPDGSAEAVALSEGVCPTGGVGLRGGYVVAGDERVALALYPSPAVVVLCFHVDLSEPTVISRGVLSRDAKRIVLCGIVNSLDERCLAQAQVCVRRAGLDLFNGCAIAVVPSRDTQKSSPSSGILRVSSEVTSSAPNLGGLVDDIIFDSSAVSAQGEGEFYAHAGWDTPAKIQAVVDALELDELPAATVFSVSPEPNAKSSPSLNAATDLYHDGLPEDFSAAQDEQEWLTKFGKLLEERELKHGSPSPSTTSARASQTQAERPGQGASLGGSNKSSSGAAFFQGFSRKLE